MPYSSSTSAALVTGVAPSLSNAFVPAESADVDITEDGEDVATFLQSEVCSSVSAASLAGFDNDGRAAHAGDDPVPRRKAPRRRLDARLVLREHEARPHRSRRASSACAAG